MDNIIRSISAGVSLIATDKTWIEGKAIQQLQTTAALDNMVHVTGMPDLHPGRGYPIGAAFFSVKQLYPALVGNDIGCGMNLWQTDLLTHKLSLDKLEKRLGNIDGPLDDDTLTDFIGDQRVESGFERALGTIGGGNHFAELQKIDHIYQPEMVDAIGLDAKRLLLLVHSGSRGLGQLILQQHVSQFGHRGLSETRAECQHYLAQHDSALRFAQLNRQLIAMRILQRLHTEGRSLLDVHHNLVSAATVNGVTGWLHRKGATPADKGEVIIPGSRGDYSYLVRPQPCAASLYSLAHGAGRKWMRSECKDRLSARYSVESLSRTHFASRVICLDRQLIYEEAPEAYKPIDSVIDAMKAAGLITVLARLTPVLTYKTAGGNG